jgi:cysteinyl-tRNA synthetase
MDSEKMSKSVGNIVSLDEVLDRWGADAVRLFILSSYYRSPLTYTAEALDAAKTGAERLREAAFAVSGSGEPVDPGDARERFEQAMDNDLGTPQAIAVLFELARAINRGRDEGRDINAVQALFRELAGVLGFTLEATAASGGQEAAPFIDLLVALRTELRAAKQWALADRVRDGLKDLGVELKDGAEGTTWTAG